MTPKPSNKSRGSARISNVLASRYASQAMQNIWSEAGKVVLEREFWIAVMKAQRELGIDIPPKAIAAYESVKDQVDLESIRQRERITKHDVKARIEEFCALAGCEHLHKGLTSRDLTDNVEQLQVRKALELIRTKYAALLYGFSERAEEWKEVVIVGRTHNVAAQLTTVGKRIAMYGEEMLHAFERLDNLLQTYPLRGLKGPVGTGLDQLTLFEGNAKKARSLRDKVCKHLGFATELNAVGQVYPRSLDFEVVSALYQLGSGPANFARTLRLMVGYELATEGFQEGQVGSSAMPHKMNSRSSERINGLQVILGGHVHMAGSLAGDQWFEGDVSCSVVRRVMLPDSFFAMDGLIETTLHVIHDMGIYPATIQAETQRYLPFLATTTFLMEAVKKGLGREEAHEIIKEHAVKDVLEMRQTGRFENRLIHKLAGDSRWNLSKKEMEMLLNDPKKFHGMAIQQVETFKKDVQKIIRRFPAAAQIQPGELL